MPLIHGFDVSAYQGPSAPAADFVFVKATEGRSYTSGKFAAQWASAKTRAKIRGAYHFARPEQSSAAHQADRFVDVVQPVPGEMLCLDLEASELSQSATNAWARRFGDRLRERAPGVTTVLYMGSGYATNGTGQGLNKHFDLWWYPQYPSAKATTRWPATFSPWLPSGLTTGWERPHIWQWTSNYSGRYDANVSWLTTHQLAAPGGRPTLEDDVYGGQIPAGKGGQVNISFPRGRLKALGLVIDNDLALPGVIEAQPQAEVRVAVHRHTGAWQVETVKVGRAPGDDKTVKTVIRFDNPADVDFVSIVRLDAGATPVGWDMS